MTGFIVQSMFPSAEQEIIRRLMKYFALVNAERKKQDLENLKNGKSLLDAAMIACGGTGSIVFPYKTKWDKLFLCKCENEWQKMLGNQALTSDVVHGSVDEIPADINKYSA